MYFTRLTFITIFEKGVKISPWNICLSLKKKKPVWNTEDTMPKLVFMQLYFSYYKLVTIIAVIGSYTDIDTNLSKWTGPD